MTSQALLFALVALVVGGTGGWLLHATRMQVAAGGNHDEAIRLRAILETERGSARDNAIEQEHLVQQLRESFAALSAQALRQNNDAFVAMAEARMNGVRMLADDDLGKRQLAVEALVSPLRSTLDQVQQQLHEVERSRAGSFASLSEQINGMRQTSENLRGETAQLVNALRAPQVRGRWGEMQLQRTVEAAGLTEHIDFVTQATSTTDDGTLRPDMIVRLVGGKNVVVDSKVAFAGYLEAMEAKDEPTRNARLKAHARHLRDHIDALGAKAYWQRFTPAPEFVVCFVPADAFLDAALQQDQSLLEHAFSRDVVIATPSTLVALLRTIAYTWRQDALAANAAEVHQLGRDLYQRLSKMGSHLERLGRSLDGAVESYNHSVGSLESRVFVTARKLNDLKVVAPSETLAQPMPLTATARAPHVEEFGQTVVPFGSAGRSIGPDEMPDNRDGAAAG